MDVLNKGMSTDRPKRGVVVDCGDLYHIVSISDYSITLTDFDEESIGMIEEEIKAEHPDFFNTIECTYELLGRIVCVLGPKWSVHYVN